MFIQIKIKYYWSIFIFIMPIMAFGNNDSTRVIKEHIPFSQFLEWNEDHISPLTADAVFDLLNEQKKGAPKAGLDIKKENEKLIFKYQQLEVNGALTKTDNGEKYYKLNNTKDQKFFDIWVNKEFPNLTTVLKYDSRVNKVKGWSIDTILNRLTIPHELDSISKLVFRNRSLRLAMFNILIYSYDKRGGKNIVISNEKIRLAPSEKADFDETFNFIKYQKESEVVIKAICPITCEENPLLYILGLWALLSLIGLSFLSYYYVNIVRPYQKKVKDLPAALIDNLQKNKGLKFTPEDLIDHLMINQHNANNELLNLKNKIKNININEDNFKEELKKALKEALYLEQEILEGLFKPKKEKPVQDVIKNLLAKPKTTKEQINDIINHVDQKYNSSLKNTIEKLGQEAADYKTYKETLKNENSESSIRDIKNHLSKEALSIDDIHSFLKLFNFKNIEGQLNSIKSNNEKAIILQDKLKIASKLKNTNKAILAIEKFSLVIDGVEHFSNIGDSLDIKQIILDGLIQSHLLDTIVTCDSPSKMHKTIEAEEEVLLEAIGESNVIIKNESLDKVISAFTEAQNFEENKVYFSVFYDRYKGLFNELRTKSEERSEDVSWIISILIEMSLHAFDLSCQQLTKGVALMDKRTSVVNYQSILHNKKLSETVRQYGSIQKRVSESDIFIQNFIDFLRVFKIKSLRNVLINGYEITDEILATGKGDMRRYNTTPNN